jgi:1-aminocyclopropane-1-carboxylate deaminase/D-cysteine desulfhydrase-like pyridoxal-dependent ACC family enzyme
MSNQLRKFKEDRKEIYNTVELASEAFPKIHDIFREEFTALYYSIWEYGQDYEPKEGLSFDDGYDLQKMKKVLDEKQKLILLFNEAYEEWRKTPMPNDYQEREDFYKK